MSAIQMRVDIENLLRKVAAIEADLKTPDDLPGRVSVIEARISGAVGDLSKFLARAMESMSARLDALEAHNERYKRDKHQKPPHAPS